MSLLWADNGNLYGVGMGSGGGPGAGQARALEGAYVQFGNDDNYLASGMAADPDPASNGDSIFCFTPAAGARYDEFFPKLRKVLAVAKTEVGMFARLWWAAFAADNENGPQIRFAGSGNGSNVWLQVTNIGSIRVYAGTFNNGEPAVLGESPAVLTAAAHHHIEARVKFHATAGEVEVYVNGIQCLNLSAVDTAPSSADCQNISVGRRASGSGSGGGNVYWKDFVVWDKSGTVNNDFFGTCQVGPYMPDGDVGLNWTPSSGATGYPLINEVNGPNDGNYISATVAQTTASEFSIQNVAPDVTSIRGFVIFDRAQKSDGGDCNVQVGVKSAGSPALGSDRPITTAFTYWTDVIELDPATGFQFTPTAFNDMTLTVDRTV